MVEFSYIGPRRVDPRTLVEVAVRHGIVEVGCSVSYYHASDCGDWRGLDIERRHLAWLRRGNLADRRPVARRHGDHRGVDVARRNPWIRSPTAPARRLRGARPFPTVFTATAPGLR